jgi:hypothetical protein
MSSFGTGGLFLCYVVVMLFLTVVIGWWALAVLILVTLGYAGVMQGMNDRYYPDGKVRPRSNRRKKRR